MFVYWLMYFIPAGMALFVGRSRQYNPILWFALGALFIIIIGLRHDVGGDWHNYLRHYENAINISLTQALEHGDPAHKFINWLMAKWDFGIYGVNFIYAIIFVIGLFNFSKDQLNPWLALTVSVPYLVVIVSMGYSRQGVAIGLFMLAIVSLRKGNFKTYIALIIFAATFHKTAILLLPLGVFLYGKGLFLRLLMIIPLLYGAWDLLLEDKQDVLWHNYVEKQMQSQGAMIRVFMNFLPSLLLLMYRKKWKRSFNDYTFWFWISIGSIMAMFLVNFAPTAVDRISLYFIPIQLVVYSRLPYLASGVSSQKIIKIVIVVGYASVLFVWLNYASHNISWLGYENILLKDIL